MRGVIWLVGIVIVTGACQKKAPPKETAASGTAAPQPDAAVLSVTAVEPAQGDVEGGTYVVLRGSNFMKEGPRSAKVYFGSRQGTIVRFQSDIELIVQAPGGKPGETVDVLVIFDPGGQMKIPNAFTFVDKSGAAPTVDDLEKGSTEKLKVTGIEPAKGDAEGGTYVVVKGSRFLKDGPRNVKVYFGATQGTVIRFQSDSELIVQAPAGKANESVDVRLVFEPGGELVVQNGFSFVTK